MSDTSMSGGSADTGQHALTVTPMSSRPSAMVSSVTPAGHAASASEKPGGTLLEGPAARQCQRTIRRQPGARGQLPRGAPGVGEQAGGRGGWALAGGRGPQPVEGVDSRKRAQRRIVPQAGPSAGDGDGTAQA